MENKVEVKVRIKGECIIMSVKQSFTIEKILDFLRIQKIILPNIKTQDFIIKNNVNGQIIASPQIKLINILPLDSNNARCLQIILSGEPKSKFLIPTVQNAQYQYATEQIFNRACDTLLTHNFQELRSFYQEKKISKELFVLFHKISDNILVKSCNKGLSELQNKKPNQNVLFMKQQEKKQNNLQAIIKNKSQIIQTKQSELRAILQLLKSIKNQNNWVQIMQQRRNKISQSIFNQLKCILQNFDNKVKQVHNQLERSIAKSSLDMQEMSVKSIKNINYSLLIKSKTFEIQCFKKKLQQSSLLIKGYIQNFAKNTIKSITSEYFDLLGNNSIRQFIKQVKDKENVLFLFSTQTEIFGMYSIYPLGKMKKSDKGFLFSLTRQKFILPKEKQPLWKQSNYDIKIGNDNLIMCPSLKGKKLKMKKDGKMLSTFQMQGIEDKQLLGTQSNVIQIISFECMTIIFEEVLKYEQLSQSVYEKVEESIR